MSPLNNRSYFEDRQKRAEAYAVAEEIIQKARLKPIFRNIWRGLIALGAVGLLAAGYYLPHPSPKVPAPKVLAPKVVEKIVEKQVFSDPNSPMTINTMGRWNIYREKATGCTWMEPAEGGYWVTVYLPSDKCTNFTIPEDKK